MDSFGVTKAHAEAIGAANGNNLFGRHKKLMAYEYTIRLDGIFVFELKLNNASDTEAILIASDVSNTIKTACGHVHDFHSYTEKGTKKTKFIDKLKQGVLSFLHIQGLLSSTAYKAWDLLLQVPPVELKTPYGAENKLEDIASPDGENNPILYLETKFPERSSNHPRRLSKQLACLRLRAIYTRKKETCMYAYLYTRNYWFAESILAPFFYMILAYLFSVLMINILIPQIGCKTQLTFPIIPALAVFFVIDSARRMFRLELLQRMVGFYSYANILSKILEGLYSMVGNKTAYVTSTGNFADIIKTVEVRYNLEKDKIERRKFFLAMMFTVITVTLAALKFAAESEKIPSTHGIVEQQRFDKLDFICEYFDIGGANSRQTTPKKMAPTVPQESSSPKSQ